MDQGKNIVIQPFASSLKFTLGAGILFIAAWCLCMLYLSANIEGGLKTITANPMDVRLLLLFIAVYGAVAGVIISAAWAMAHNKTIFELITEGFFGCFAGICGAVINWIWALMIILWMVVFAIPVGIKAIIAMDWPGAGAFFIFFSQGPFNSGVITYDNVFWVFWIGGLVAAFVFLLMFYKTPYDGFTPVVSRRAVAIIMAIGVCTGVLALLVPNIGMSIMGIMLIGSISVAPLISLHDCLACGNNGTIQADQQSEAV